MMRSLPILMSACLVSLSLTPAKAFAAQADPTLIIQITLDQFRADYVTRFAPAFSGGLKQILEGGLIDLSGEVDHGITNSYPGHVSLSTGMYPASHGYSANEWWGFEDEKWTWIDGGADSNTHFVGQPDRVSFSPVNLRATTIGEWVKQSDPAAKSISLAASEIAVAYGGHASDGVYWYDVSTTNFVTSSYYRNDYPNWVDAFNASEMPVYRIDSWQLGVPDRFLSLAEVDDSIYENSGEDRTFPHNFEATFDVSEEDTREQQYASWLANTPMRDMAVIDLAMIAIDAEQLGQRGAIDYLSVTLSATDSIGHNFGGRSLEALDALIRVDFALGKFIDFLDNTLGRDGYVLAIAGDHGAPDPIEYTQQQGGLAYRVSIDEIDAVMEEIEEFGNAFEGTKEELTLEIEAILESKPFVADAVTQSEVYGATASENPYIGLFRNSWVAGRIADFPLWGRTSNQVHHPARYGIYVQFNENTYFEWATVVHGSPYDYDRHVPIMFFGAGVTAGEVYNLRTIDVAPTLAHYARITVPPAVDGEIFRE